MPETGLGTSMQSIKALTKSVKDLSSISEMSDISKSTSELLTGETFKKSALKKRMKALGGTTDGTGKKKSISQTSLVHASDDSISISSDTKISKKERPKSYHSSVSFVSLAGSFQFIYSSSSFDRSGQWFGGYVIFNGFI